MNYEVCVLLSPLGHTQFLITEYLNQLRMKLYPSDLKAQSVPRCKHSLPRL